MEKPVQKPTRYTTSEAVALAVQMDIGKTPYRLMAQSAKARNAPIYPCYDLLLEEKKKTWMDADMTYEREREREIKQAFRQRLSEFLVADTQL